MKIDRLKLGNNYTIDNECIELLKYHLCTHLCTKNKVEEYNAKNITIMLDFPLKIIYNKKHYWTCIVKDKEDQCYWYVRPYNKSYFTTKTDEHNTTTFDIVIQAIIENDLFQNK